MRTGYLPLLTEEEVGHAMKSLRSIEARTGSRLPWRSQVVYMTAALNDVLMGKYEGLGVDMGALLSLNVEAMRGPDVEGFD